MKVPKYIDTALQRRVRAAMNFTLADATLREFINTHNIPVEEYDYAGGCEAYVHPRESAERIREAILSKE